MKQKILYILLFLCAWIVSLGAGAVDIAWKNDWSSAPGSGSSFYLYNTSASKFLLAGIGENSTDAFCEAANASLWTYSSNTLKSGNNQIKGKTSTASTNGTGNLTNYSFQISNGAFDIYAGALASWYHLYKNKQNQFATNYSTSKTNGAKYEWYLVSATQYNNHRALEAYDLANSKVNGYSGNNLPDAVWNEVKDYVNSTTDYLNYSSWLSTTDMSEDINNATGKINEWLAKYGDIASISKNYLAAIETINTFESEYASKTPDTVNPVNDIAAARSALESAESSDDIVVALANIKAYDVITITQQPAATLPLHGETTVEATANNTVVYTSNNTEVITMEGSKATAIAEGRATITLTTETSTTHYAAMPVTTTAIVVTDALILNSTTIANYSPATYGTVVLERTLKVGYNSIAMPFEASLADLGADKAYQLSVVTYNAKDGYSLYFKEVTSLTANEPYIIHLEAEKMNPTFSNVAVVAAQPVEKEATGGVNRNDVSYKKWKMVSNYAVGFNMDGKYGVVNADGCLKLGATGSTLAPFSAYIENVSDTSLPSDASTETDKQMVKALFLNGASAIEDVINGNDALTGDPEAVYDLQGRKASAESKGVRIVIMNDGTTKKVIK